MKECYNPTVHQIKKAICFRALHPDQPIPAPDPEMVSQTKLLQKLIGKNLELVNELRGILKIKQGKLSSLLKNDSLLRSKFFFFLINQFTYRIVVKEKGKTSKRKFADANRPATQVLSLDELLSTESQENGGKRAKPDSDILSETLSTISQQEIVREVGTTNPVKNFKAMVSNKSEDLVSTGNFLRLR